MFEQFHFYILNDCTDWNKLKSKSVYMYHVTASRQSKIQEFNDPEFNGDFLNIFCCYISDAASLDLLYRDINRHLKRVYVRYFWDVCVLVRCKVDTHILSCFSDPEVSWGPVVSVCQILRTQRKLPAEKFEMPAANISPMIFTLLLFLSTVSCFKQFSFICNFKG